MNRFMGFAYIVSTVALFSWLLGQIAQGISFFSAASCAANAIWPKKDEGEK